MRQPRRHVNWSAVISGLGSLQLFSALNYWVAHFQDNLTVYHPLFTDPIYKPPAVVAYRFSDEFVVVRTVPFSIHNSKMMPSIVVCGLFVIRLTSKDLTSIEYYWLVYFSQFLYSLGQFVAF